MVLQYLLRVRWRDICKKSNLFRMPVSYAKHAATKYQTDDEHLQDKDYHHQ